MKRVNLFLLIGVAFTMVPAVCLASTDIPLGGDDESKHPPPYKSQANVAVYYSSPKIDPERKNGYFIKVVVQERTVMRYKQADLGNGSHYWYIAPEPVWQKRYLYRSGIDGRNPTIAAELPDDRFSYENSWGDQEYMRWSGILGFDVSWSQQTVAFSVGRRTNSIEILDLKTSLWTEHSLHDPKRPQRGVRSADSLQFINNGAVVLASAGDNILVTIDLNGHENIKNIENEIRDALPTNSNRRNIDVQQFVGLPVWNEKQKLIAVMGHESALLFDTNLVFQQAVKVFGKGARILTGQDNWVLEGTSNHQGPQSFTLVSHKLVDTTISPNEAAAVW